MTGEKLLIGPVQPGLMVEHCSVSVDGRSVGLAASLGNSFVLYTTDERLQELDGIRFDSMEKLQATVSAAIRKASETGIAA